MNPDRHYPLRSWDDTLKKLGGFAATLKIVMKMLQWGHAQGENGARAARCSRAAALMTVPGVAMAALLMIGLVIALFTALASPAKAEVYTPHLRHVAVHRAAHHRSHPKARRTSGSIHHAGKAASYREAAYARKDNAHARRAVARRTERASSRLRRPELRRVSSRRRRGAARRRSDRLDVVARAEREDAKPAERTLASSETARKDAAASGIYDSGVSRPDENVSLSQGAAVTASVEAAPDRDAHTAHNAPADLVGAPVVAQGRAPRRAETPAENRDERLAATEVVPPTHTELAEEVEQPVVLPGLYRDGRLVVPRPMRGTREILVHQNLMADEEGLSRVQDDDDLRRMRVEHMLVDFPEGPGLRVNSELASDRRCARPWTVRFAENIARSYYARFREPLQVNSAVRTVAYQVRLRRVNGNAAGIDGDVASPHLTGEALDFGKHGMSRAEIAWMRLYLRPLMQDGKLDVEEEFQQACFHISVYRSYAPDLPVRRRVRSEYAQVQDAVSRAGEVQ